MKSQLKIKITALAGAVMLITAWAVSAQTSAIDKHQTAAGKTATGQTAAGLNLQVLGSGTVGQLPKWTGITSTTSFLGDSVISETKQGNIGIGTTTPASKLTVQGMIETTLGGYKFPDGTIQTTAAVSGLASIAHDATLKGDGSIASPLGIKAPLKFDVTASEPVIFATNRGTGEGILGLSFTSAGVLGKSDSGIGAEGQSASGRGVQGDSDSNTGVRGISNTGAGVEGVSFKGSDGVRGISDLGDGVRGSSNNSAGVHGTSNLNFGVLGESEVGTAVIGMSPKGFGVAGFASKGLLAGDFGGDVRVNGDLNVVGQKNFKIDHPLDPANKYLVHAAIESSEVKNLYDGIVTLDSNGEAVIKLPDWFQSLNNDFRYSLTSIGGFAPVYVAEKIANNQFRIAGGQPGMEISWQVTGIRSDAYMQKHPMKVEVEKSEFERGHYLQPELYNQPEDKSVDWAHQPELMQRVKDMREKSKQ